MVKPKHLYTCKTYVSITIKGDNMEMYYKLISDNNKDCYLFCEVDMDTIDDDEIDYRCEQNDGTWDFISQALVDFSDDEELHQVEMGGATLLISSNYEVIK